MTVKSPKISSIEQARQSLRPAQPEFEKKELTAYFPKDSIFNKIKIYLSKKKDEGGQEKDFEADWRNINVSANHIVLFKGVALSKAQLGHFDAGAKKHYLEDKGKAKKAAPKVEPEAKEEAKTEA